MKSIFSPKSIYLLCIFALLILITGCANNEPVDQCLTGHTYGFLGGLWHGFIAPFDFIGMLFSKEITMYAQNNNGGLYALGFLLGGGGWGFFGGRGIHRIHRTKVDYHSRKFDDAVIVE
jgi:hypothetical protein